MPDTKFCRVEIFSVNPATIVSEYFRGTGSWHQSPFTLIQNISYFGLTLLQIPNSERRAYGKWLLKQST